MRLFDYIYEGIVDKALSIGEPEVGKKYMDDYVEKVKSQLKTALAQAKKDSYVDDDAKNAVLSDLQDKLNKWENVEKETKPAKPPAKPEGEKEEKKPDEEPPADEEKPESNDDEEDLEKKKEEDEKEDEERRKENEKRREELKKKNENRLIKTRIKVK